MLGDVFDASRSLFALVDQNKVVKLRARSLDPRGFRSDGTTLRYVTVIRYQKGFGGPPSASPWVEWVRQRGGWWSSPPETPDRLGAPPVALIRGVGRLGRTGRVAKMMIHLAAQRSLDQRLLERQRRGIDGFCCHRTVAKLLKQFGRNRRQFHRLGFRFARHTLSLRECYALNTKFLTGPISEQTYYRWKKQYAGLESNQVRELKQLQDENERLKKLVAELSLDKAILQDIATKKWPRPR